MPAKHHLLGATAAAAIVLAGTSAEAAFTVTDRFIGDDTYTSRFAADTIAEVRGRAGLPNGAERQLEIDAPQGGSNEAEGFFDWSQDATQPDQFTISYDSTNRNLSFAITGGPTISQNFDLSNAKSILIRARGNSVSENIQLLELTFNGHLIDGGSLMSTGVPSYQAFSGPIGEDWTLAGDAFLLGGERSQVAFQAKFNEAVVPLPAAAWLMLSGLAGVGYTAYRGRRSAAA